MRNACLNKCHIQPNMFEHISNTTPGPTIHFLPSSPILRAINVSALPGWAPSWAEALHPAPATSASAARAADRRSRRWRWAGHRPRSSDARNSPSCPRCCDCVKCCDLEIAGSKLIEFIVFEDLCQISHIELVWLENVACYFCWSTNREV